MILHAEMLPIDDWISFIIYSVLSIIYQQRAWDCVNIMRANHDECVQLKPLCTQPPVSPLRSISAQAPVFRAETPGRESEEAPGARCGVRVTHPDAAVGASSSEAGFRQ